MARPPKPFHLKAQDKKELKRMLSRGIQQVRVVLRAMALLQLDAGMSAHKVSRTVPFAAQAIRTIAKRYQQGGLERARFERKRTGHAELLQASDKQRIIAMVCSQPPEGRARWTVRLVAEEAVKRKLVSGGSEERRVGKE